LFFKIVFLLLLVVHINMHIFLNAAITRAIIN